MSGSKGALGVYPGRPGLDGLDFVRAGLDIGLSGPTGPAWTWRIKKSTRQMNFGCCVGAEQVRAWPGWAVGGLE